MLTTIRHAQAADFMVAMETSCGLAEKERRDESLGEKEESVLVVCFPRPGDTCPRSDLRPVVSVRSAKLTCWRSSAGLWLTRLAASPRSGAVFRHVHRLHGDGRRRLPEPDPEERRQDGPAQLQVAER